MIDFIESPNLPKGKVRTVICGTDDRDILDFFKKMKIKVLKTAPNNGIDIAVTNHADMAVLHLKRNKIILDKSQTELNNVLENIGMEVFETKKEIIGAYPNDVKLNFTVIGEKVFGNFRYADEELLRLISDKSKIIVRQGYCKCSMLIINQNAVITDDESIHRQMLANGTESLLISKGDISLPGHEYGFIGGASGKISKNMVVFFGNIEKHRDFYEIRKFLCEHHCQYVCTDKNILRDIGGIIPILEEKTSEKLLI